MRKKVLFITHVSTLMGANKSLLSLLEGTKDSIEPLVILPNEGPLCKELIALKIKYYIINFKHTSCKVERNFKHVLKFIPRIINILLINYFYLRKLNKLISSYEIDIIHSNSSVITIGYKLSILRNVPHVWHIREFQDLDYNINYIFGRQNLISLLQKSTASICISKSVASHFDLLSKSYIIYNGVTQKNFIRAPQNKKNFLFCGALIPSKGLEDALFALNKINNETTSVKLTVIGTFTDDQYKRHIFDLIKSLNIENSIDFLGFKEDIEPYMKTSIALLMCSRNEGFGRVTVEAMLNKCLVIGFNSAGTKEIISHKKTGLLYDESLTLDHCLNFALKNNICCDYIKEAAFSYAINNFSEIIYSRKILNVYENIIRR